MPDRDVMRLSPDGRVLADLLFTLSARLRFTG
jgi:hypothetical protein